MAGFKNLEDLVGDLSAGLVKLRAGELEPEELTPLVEDARELCDRLILLRFKAHEFAYEVRKKAPEGAWTSRRWTVSRCVRSGLVQPTRRP